MNMYDKIVNPLTGRKVSVNGKIGKRVLNNYLIQIGGSVQEATIQEPLIVEEDIEDDDDLPMAYNILHIVNPTYTPEDIDTSNPIKVLVICSSDKGRDFPRIKEKLKEKIIQYFETPNINWDYLCGEKGLNFPIDINDTYNAFIFTGCNMLSWILPTIPIDPTTGMIDITKESPINTARDKFTNNLIKYKTKNPIILFIENTKLTLSLTDFNKVFESTPFYVLSKNFLTIHWEYLRKNMKKNKLMPNDEESYYRLTTQLFNNLFTVVNDFENKWIYYEKK